MRVNPVTSADRANVRRKRPPTGETASEHQPDFASNLPVPVQPVLEQEQAAFATRYYPNSVFLAHLIATRDNDPQTRTFRRVEPLRGVDSYRATAALPRQRAAGHLLKTER
ncbi:hypothetical protein [Roseibium marinum]|uniref:Uncharacterized protein n=1 Tax=Roseibium marinum TaxID=281252 RepID=A0A2S3UYK3_9HYPH|nr:hypothetical protein [Roseibium marinum]POF32766.1 hypothetical protein CLV41_102171 [Roseibium marinum]